MKTITVNLTEEELTALYNACYDAVEYKDYMTENHSDYSQDDLAQIARYRNVLARLELKLGDLL